MIQDLVRGGANDTAADGAGICWRDSEGWGPGWLPLCKRPVAGSQDSQDGATSGERIRTGDLDAGILRFIGWRQKA